MTNATWLKTGTYFFMIGTFVSPVLLSFGIKLGDAVVPMVFFIGWTGAAMIKFLDDDRSAFIARMDQLEQQVASLELEQQDEQDEQG